VDVGARNVNFVWCPNAVYSGGLSLDGLYPGDATSNGRAWTRTTGAPARPARPLGVLPRLLAPTYDQLVRIAPGKSIMIAETSSSESGGSKADWIRDALTVELPQNFPLVKAVVWFNWNADGMDWVIESSATTQQAFADSIALPYYAANEFAALEGGLIRPPRPCTVLGRQSVGRVPVTRARGARTLRSRRAAPRDRKSARVEGGFRRFRHRPDLHARRAVQDLYARAEPPRAPEPVVEPAANVEAGGAVLHRGGRVDAMTSSSYG